MYQYASKVTHVVDGDTVDLSVDLGFMVSVLVRFRLADINAPEMKNETLAAGKASKAHLEALLGDAQMGIIRLDSLGKDKYGRWVAKLYYVSVATGETVDVNAKMIADGFAVAYVP
jgi:micrococcal nuclease